MYNDNQSRGRKETVLSRYRAVLGPARAPSGLGLLFLLSMVHELARADSGELSAQQLAELSARLVVQRGELLAVVDVIRNSYPEISDQLFGEQAFEVTGGRGSEIDLLVLAEEITALEESGYLDREEILRLHKALEALQEGDWSGDDVVVAQAGPAEVTGGDSAGDGKARTGAGEGGAAGAEEVAVDIEALPPPGAGPLVALGPLVAGGAFITAADIIDEPGPKSAPADTTTPVYVSTSTSIVNQKITLTYSEALSATGQPLLTSFQVQTRPTAGDPWTTATITNVEVSGSTVTISLQGTPLAAGRLLQVTYTDPSAGNDANSIQDLAGNDAASVVISTGIVADGYVRGAQIYIDTNRNGVAEAGERLDGVVTDANGNFFLPDSANGPILAVGGVNIDTGIPNTMVMKAPAGSAMVTPLTTLVQSYVEQNGGTVAAANNAVTSALGLPTSVNLTSYDPLAILAGGADATALAVQQAAATVATVVQAAAANPATGVSTTTVVNNVIANLVNQIETANTGSTTVDLTNTTTLGNVYGTVTTVNTSTVSTAATNIANATDLGGVSQAQANLLDTITPAAPSAVALAPASDSGAQGDGVTSATTPGVRVSLNVTTTDGTAAVAGNTVSIHVGGSASAAASVVLSATNITNGYVDIPVAGLAANSTLPHSLTAKITDSTSKTSTASTAFNLTIDTMAPVAAPGFALAQDSGVSSTDGITGNGMVNVSSVETGASWQYSTDGGSHWTQGSGSSFTLPGSALYLAGAVQVRQVDVAGNTGAATVSSSNITVGLGTPLTIPAGAAETTAVHTLIAQGNADHYLTGLDLEDNATTLNSTEAALLVQAGLEFATDDAVTVQQAAGTHLTTSMSGLQHLGVDAITVIGAGGEFVIPAGTGTVDYAHLPTITADPGVTVGLELADSLQNAPTSAAQAANLLASGIDVLMAADGTLSVGSAQIEAIRNGGLSFDAADTITMQMSSANEGAAISNLVASLGATGAAAYDGDLDILDALDGAISISDAQAAALVGAGLQFAAADAVTLDANVAGQGPGVGTHLQTSLTGLQQLGVDMLNITGATTGVVDIQAGSAADLAQLPTISAPSGVMVGLEMSDAALDGLSGTQLTAIATHGIDVLSASDNTLALDSTRIEAIHGAGLQLNPADSVTMQIAQANEGVAITNLVAEIGTPGTYRGDLDVLDVVDNSISLTDAQASSLVQAGLHFAALDTDVALAQSHAAGTHLNTSLSDLQRLGVDYVHTDAGQDTLVVNFGSGLSSNTLPVFDDVDQVQVVVQDSSLNQMIDFLNAGDKNDPNIDQLAVVLNATLGTTAGLAGDGILDAALQAAFDTPGTQDGIRLGVANSILSEVTLGMVLDAADASADSLHLLSGNDLVSALQAAGVIDINIDAVTHFSVSDSDLKPLLDAGLITAAAGAEVSVTNANADGTLDVTLAQLANIGADHVQTGGINLTLNAGLSYSSTTELQSLLDGLVNTFQAQGVGTSSSTTLFESADTVELRVTGDLSGFTLDTTLTAKLQLLGIDEIRDENNHSIKPS